MFYNGWESDHFGGKDLAALRTNRRYFPHTPWQPMVMRNPIHPEGYEEVALGEKNPRWWGCSALPSRIVVDLMLKAHRTTFHTIWSMRCRGR
ncbi:hypothetical protein ACFYTF_13450 [Nocardia thailandica]|uniref:Uncharacterized protein n=1 Tax=Nocardia thailandica TaxID=257275 RepID=A0ABW6PN50_9NOCA